MSDRRLKKAATQSGSAWQLNRLSVVQAIVVQVTGKRNHIALGFRSDVSKFDNHDNLLLFTKC
jgi:hypothetical protein